MVNKIVNKLKVLYGSCFYYAFERLLIACQTMSTFLNENFWFICWYRLTVMLNSNSGPNHANDYFLQIKVNLKRPSSLHSRDLVHRQTASAVVQHMSLGVYGFGCEDSLNHLLNYVWPNVFETSPHVIQAVMGALEGLRVAIGPCRMLQYCLQVG